LAKALIISGDEGTRYLYQVAISYQKIQVEVAPNIAEGIKKVQKFGPDLVVLDIMVSDIKDIPKLKELKGTISSMPVIILVDMKNTSEPKEASILGAAKTLVKSESSLGELIKTVRKAVKE
jgi:two-component system OmpR family response regulator